VFSVSGGVSTFFPETCILHLILGPNVVAFFSIDNLLSPSGAEEASSFLIFPPPSDGRLFFASFFSVVRGFGDSSAFSPVMPLVSFHVFECNRQDSVLLSLDDRIAHARACTERDSLCSVVEAASYFSF